MTAAIACFDKRTNSAGISGTVRFEPKSGLTSVTIDLDGFADQKAHGIHIHEYGDLTPTAVISSIVQTSLPHQRRGTWAISSTTSKLTERAKCM